MAFIFRVLESAIVIAAIPELSRRWPRIGALLLTLPLTSILAFLFIWQSNGDLKSLSLMARETLVLVPLALPFFVPLAFAERMRMGFWSALFLGVIAATATVAAWYWISANAK